MIFFLRKFIESLLLPIGISGFLVIVSVLLRRRWLALAGVGVLYLFSTLALSNLILRPLEDAYPPKAVAEAGVADAIIVLGGSGVRGITASGVQWGESANRYFAGYDLAAAGKAKVIVFSGAQAQDVNGPSQGAIMRQVAIRSGIAAERIMVTPRVLTTEDEARTVSKMPGIHSVLLVTSALHMPRSVLLFRAAGLDVIPFSTDQRILDKWRLAPAHLIPTSGGLQRSEEAMREYYGLAVYHIILFFRPL